MTAGLIRSGHDVVNRETGEVVAPRVDMTTYLERLGNDEAMKEQTALSAAYDKACASIIGANDVQIEGNRSFKKKSAWRKLQRYFSISTQIISAEREYLGAGSYDIASVFMATVTVRAVAPWGQFAEAVGACATDEESGQRTITIADAMATAETRATNRAVSNLIAMGEVSAEEMTKGQAAAPGAPRESQAATPLAFREFKIPFGPSKQTKLRDMSEKDLNGALDWASDKGKFPDFITAGEKELLYRKNPEKFEPKKEEPVAAAGSTPAAPTNKGEAPVAGLPNAAKEKPENPTPAPTTSGATGASGANSADRSTMRQTADGSPTSKKSSSSGFDDFPSALEDRDDDLPF